jgi:flagellar motor protein MotB
LVEQVRQIIYAAVKDDKRYADFKRDFIRNQEMDINTMKAHLLEAARDCDDLVGESKVSKRALKAAAKAAAASATQVGGKGGRKGGKGDHQIAQPTPKGDATNSQRSSAQDTAHKLSKELCVHFLYNGSCRYGEACMRKHVDLADINREADKREKQRQNKSDEGDDEDKSMEDESDKSDSEEKSDEKEDTDKDTSTEDESDESDSEHVTPGKRARAKACRVKRQPVPIDLLPGALVMIPNNSRHYGLRGILGQIIGTGLKGRYRVQLAPQPNRDVLTCQLVELAFELGMIMDDFVVIPKSNYAMVLKANKAYKEMGTSQKDFSANAIFDSGSELLLTGCKGILHNFRKLNKPMIAEGVHTTEAQYTRSWWRCLLCHARGRAHSSRLLPSRRNDDHRTCRHVG